MNKFLAIDSSNAQEYNDELLYFLNALADKFQVVAATFYIFTSKRSNNIKVISKRNLSVCLHGTRVLRIFRKIHIC